MTSENKKQVCELQLHISHFNKEYSRLNLLPDEIYKNILKYVFNPVFHLSRWENKYNTWNTKLLINRCYMCKRSAKNVPLSYNCECCKSYNYIHNKSCVCTNELICWDCAH